MARNSSFPSKTRNRTVLNREEGTNVNTQAITAETITMILDDHGVLAELRTDPEIQAVACAVAFLNSPATPAEKRFHDASTVFYDEEAESRYEVSNRILLEEQLTDRLSVRIAELTLSEHSERPF